MTDDSENNAAKKRKTIVVTHDGKAIDERVKANNIDKQELIKALDYSGINAYNSLMIKEISPIGLRGLITVSQLLNCDLIDIVKQDYKNYVPKIELKLFSGEKEMTAYIHKEEQAHKSRMAIMRRFPSTIYWEWEENIDRYSHLVKGAANYEIYTLEGILEFAFGCFSSITRQEKIQQLSRILNGRKGSIRNHIYIMDEKIYSQWAAECEILGDEMLMIIAPLHKYALFIIRSPKLVKDMISIISDDCLHFEKRTLKLLEILRESLETNQSLMEFIINLHQRKSYFYNPALKLLSPDLRAEIIAEVEKRTITV